MTGVGGDTGRGVRVAARSVRTWNRIVNLVVVVALAAALGAGAWKTRNAATAYEWHLVSVYALSEFLLAAGFHPDKRKTLRRENGEVYVTSIGLIAAFEPFHRLRDRILGDALNSGLLGGGIGAGLIVAALAGARVLGRRLGRGRRLRGGELVSAGALTRRAMPVHLRASLRLRPPEARPYFVARIPWPDGAETKHTIVSGTTGSGKTVLIADLVEQIRSHGERCVVYDKMGSYTETFFDGERDILLNPLDDRSPRWSPFLEARTARDFDTMAAALIPRQKDAADPFWITAARQLFSHGAAVLWKRGEIRNRVLVEHLLKTELSELAEAMEGTVAQSIVDPANPKTALSVRAMLTANIGAMDLLPDEGDSFSIREWIEHDGGGSLFLTSRGDQHASLRGLISTWLEIAVNALLSLPRADGRRIWVILDELPTLHQLPSLRPGLAESRQFGGCFVLGVQVFSALRDLYGRDGAETISGLCGTRVVLAAPDRDTSEWSAESLGRAEIESLSEGVSYDTGEHSGAPRDNVTLSARRDLRPLVLPAEVARLENLSGYLKFPGAWPVARIRLRYRSRKIVAERFVSRAERKSGAGTERSKEAGADTALAAEARQCVAQPGTAAAGEEARGSGEEAASKGAQPKDAVAGGDSDGRMEAPENGERSTEEPMQGELDLPQPNEPAGTGTVSTAPSDPPEASPAEGARGEAAGSGGGTASPGRSGTAPPNRKRRPTKRNPLDWQ